ncbi:MAG: hypothetical protein ABW217_04825 [Polyangiaceae bacterium]
MTQGHPVGLRRVSMSVACASALFAFGCLDDAPEYPLRTQIPPFIVSSRIKPPQAEVYEDGTPMDINVPFRSEDENEDLTALFYADLPPGSSGVIAEGTIPIRASTFDDTSRAVSYRWENQRSLRGCHSLTMVLTYDNNLAGNQPIDDTLVARVVWWMVLDDPQGTVLVRTCPRAD